VGPVDLVKKVAFRYTKFGVPKYPYNIEPIQLATLIFEIDRLKDAPGSIVEIGVARGMTTRFVCEHLVKRGYANQKLYAIDTFSSFRSSDVEYEIAHVSDQKGDIRAMFSYNDFEVWKKNFSKFPFLTAFQGDCASFPYGTIAPIKLVFLDVDLYLPTRGALHGLYEHLCDGGIIMIDDVQGGFGARKAYYEFCDDRKISPTVVGNKCGIIRK
jgi:Macrocin-O-methyltransferase (TylF)